MPIRLAFAGFLVVGTLVGPPVQAADEWVACDPVDVSTFSSRIHVQCAASVAGGIRFFARATSNAADVQRYLTTVLAAHVAGRPLQILTDLAQTTSLPPGCAVSDCRLLKAASVRN